MRKITTIILLVILCVVNCHAQGNYSKQNLVQASIDDLNQYLKKAKHLKSIGSNLLFAGAAGSVFGGLFIISGNAYPTGDSEARLVAGEILIIGGASCILIGLPIAITNSHRVNNVKRAIKNPDRVQLNLYPNFDCCYMSQELSTGITLRVRF